MTPLPNPRSPADKRTVFSRRRFLAWLAGGAAFASMPAVLAARSGPRAALAASAAAWVEHPEPRPGIDGSRVLTAPQLEHAPHLADLFDAIRTIPHVVDGIRCYCGCADLDGYYSLLSCYEGVGMAQHCEICQGQGRLAHNRWKEGQTLDQIRRAIDARYGHGGTPRRASSNGARGHCRA